MIKIFSRLLIFTLVSLILLLTYSSVVGIKTTKFNKQIKNSILKINNNFDIKLSEVQFLLNPLKFKVNIRTNNSEVFLKNHKFKISKINTNLSLKSLINQKFSINDLDVSIKKLNANNLISLLKILNNSPKFYILDKIIKKGDLSADISLNFDNNGNVKDDYTIKGFIENGKLNFLSKYKVKNLYLNYEIKKEKYTFKELKINFNEIDLLAPLIEIGYKKKLFLISGNIKTKYQDYNKDKLNFFFKDEFKKLNIEEIRFTSNNNFSFNINKKFKLNNLNITSKINLLKFEIKENLLNLKEYIPNYKEIIKFEDHEVLVNYKKNQFDISGSGNILIENKVDNLKYNITQKDELYSFSGDMDIKQNPLILNFLDYKKNSNSNSSLSVSGSFKEDNSIKFDKIFFIENKNKIKIEGLFLNKNLKIYNIEEAELDYSNNKKIQNNLFLIKKDNNYIINGKSFDGTKIINSLMGEDSNKSIFTNIDTKVNLNIDKIYIDSENFINDLSGSFSYNNDEIKNLDVISFFQNQKRLNLSIKTNDVNEKVTTFFTDYPKPLVKRYKFIKGFEEGILDYHSIKKNGVSKSTLVIDNFKVKEVPIFAKLLSLASLQGIADILTGEGIRFTDLEMKFSNTKRLMTIEEMYAIGPAVSILMEGYIESKNLISLRGTLVPATTINRSIASIPVLGNILIGKKTGEGVFGVSFKIKGAPDNLRTTVNPIKTLTPRFITRTIEKIKKN